MLGRRRTRNHLSFGDVGLKFHPVRPDIGSNVDQIASIAKGPVMNGSDFGYNLTSHPVLPCINPVTRNSGQE